MTSYSPPDYYVDITISSNDYKNLKGLSFDVDIYRSSFIKPVKGMLLLPDNLDHKSHILKSWLWVDSVRSIIPKDEELKIHLLESCDPLYQFNKIEGFNPTTGLKLSGLVRALETSKEKDSY